MGKTQKLQLLAKLHDREIARCRGSLAYFAFNYVKTRDEHDFASPIKPFPRKRYLEILFEELQHGPDVQYIAKSRQLMVSWALCVLAVWKLLCHPHSRVCFQSKKLEDAAEMVFDTTPTVARCSLILLHLPHWLRACVATDGTTERLVPVSLDGKTFTYGAIKLPNGARCDALAQGAAQVEGKVPTLYIGDEASLQEEWMSAQAAVTPCILGGGRGITVGTMRLPSDYGNEIAPAAQVDPDGLARGVARFTSSSGVPGLRIHYSADPEKDPATAVGREWFKKAVAAMPGGYDGFMWQQHMEINPMSRAGMRCIPNWEKIEHHIIIPPIALANQRGWAYCAGVDWGVRNKAVFLVLGISPDRHKYLVEEISHPGFAIGGVPGFAKLMRQSLYFDRVAGQIWADPTMWKQDQNDAATYGVRSVAQVFQDSGVTLRPAACNGQTADEIAMNRLVFDWWGQWDTEDFEPGLRIFGTCQELIKNWPQLRYEDHKNTIAGEKSLKEKMLDNGRVDEWDAFKYMIVSALPDPQHMNIEPPMGSYAWLRRHLAAQAAINKRRKP